MIVETKTGCRYHINPDDIDAAGLVWGTRINGTNGGPFRRKTQGTARWFNMRNVTIIRRDAGSMER